MGRGRQGDFLPCSKVSRTVAPSHGQKVNQLFLQFQGLYMMCDPTGVQEFSQEILHKLTVFLKYVHKNFISDVCNNISPNHLADSRKTNVVIFKVRI